jgi:hypothetical protein
LIGLVSLSFWGSFFWLAWMLVLERVPRGTFEMLACLFFATVGVLTMGWAVSNGREKKPVVAVDAEDWPV